MNTVQHYTDPLYRFLYNYVLKLPTNILLAYKARQFLKSTEFQKSSFTIKSPPKNSIDILTIAFNNVKTIEVQHRQLKKNLKDPHTYIVVDNSTRIKAVQEIGAFCRKNGVPYYQISGNPYNGRDPSMSHGLAIDWAYRNIIRPRGASYFGIIDHDIFPIKKTEIICFLKKQPVYGHFQHRGRRWYLWPGFSFYNRMVLDKVIPLFRPIMGLDTGGGNWRVMYKYIDKDKFVWPEHHYVKYRNAPTVQQSSVEVIGDWLHFMAASGWMDNDQTKDVPEILKKIIRVETST